MGVCTKGNKQQEAYFARKMLPKVLATLISILLIPLCLGQSSVFIVFSNAESTIPMVLNALS